MLISAYSYVFSNFSPSYCYFYFLFSFLLLLLGKMSLSTCAEGEQSEIAVNENNLFWDRSGDSEVRFNFVKVAYLWY